MEPQRHRDTEKRRREIAKETRKPGEEKTGSSSFVVSWVP
jgi:hypothetical protein